MRSEPSAIGRALCLPLVVIVLLAGCRTTAPRVSGSLVEAHKENDLDAQMSFWHELAEKPLASNDEAFHGLLLYLDGADQSANYEARVATLKARRMLPQGFDEPADAAVSRGNLAVAVMRAAGIRGGATVHLVGARPRYAVRELVFAGLYPPSSPNQTFSGAEFVGIIGRLEDYQRGNAADVPAAVLPGEADLKSK